MKSKTIEKWQALFKLRSEFKGSTKAFCKQHHISISGYYMYLSRLTKLDDVEQNPPLTPTQSIPSFIKVEKPNLPKQSSAQSIKFNTKTGELTLPSELEASDIVSIIRGLIA